MIGYNLVTRRSIALCLTQEKLKSAEKSAMRSASLPSTINISDTSSNKVSTILNEVAFTFNDNDIDVDGVGVVDNFKPGRS